VITPVLNYAQTRKEVDPRKIAIQGISQGGCWCPGRSPLRTGSPPPSPTRAWRMCRHPGTKTFRHLRSSYCMRGRKREFDRYLEKGLRPADKQYLAFRMRPFGTSS
jgi:hypothetical protein